jgi:hypothetical protein
MNCRERTTGLVCDQAGGLIPNHDHPGDHAEWLTIERDAIRPETGIKRAAGGEADEAAFV